MESDQFLNEIMNAMALLAFPHFGFSGWKEHYTGNFPIWQLAYNLPLWADLLDKEYGLNLLYLWNQPQIGTWSREFVENAMAYIVGLAIRKNGWQPILDAVREIPCEEDFEKRDTNVYKQFLRKWYHSRWYKKRDIIVVSLENCKADENSGVYEVEDVSARFVEDVESRDYVERFKALLSPKDKAIITLRAHGHTYEKIAEKLGYKNHSGAIKRIKHIREIFDRFEDEQNL